MRKIKNSISTIKMLMVTRLIRVVTYCKELPPINSHDPSAQLGGHGRSWDKFNTLYLHLHRTHGHHTGQDADLQLEAPIPKTL